MDSLALAQPDWHLIMQNQAEMMDSLRATKQALASTQASLSSQIATNTFNLNNLWMMIATALVFIMHLGFATLESGLTRSKNTINVLFKNTFIPLLGLITFALCGFSLMYPGFAEGSSGFLGFKGLGINIPEGGETSSYNIGYTFWTDFLFQGMFAATCATIVSGAVAERIKLVSFMICACLPNYRKLEMGRWLVAHHGLS
jgi:ammonium transporter, Amt family